MDLFETLKICTLFVCIIKMCVCSFDRDKIFLTELQLIKRSHYGQLFTYHRVWNLCNQLSHSFHFWPGLGLPRPKAIVVIPTNQPLPKHLRKKNE